MAAGRSHRRDSAQIARACVVLWDLSVHAEASSRPSFPSDTNLLVAACVARIRETARLDDDAVLPPLPVVMPRRGVVILTKSDMAGSAVGTTGQESGACGTRAGDALRRGRELAPTQRVSRPGAQGSAKRSRWALTLCGFVAGFAASAAFIASPLAHRPGVERVTHSARAHASHAAHATVNAVSTLFKR